MKDEYLVPKQILPDRTILCEKQGPAGTELVRVTAEDDPRATDGMLFTEECGHGAAKRTYGNVSLGSHYQGQRGPTAPRL